MLESSRLRPKLMLLSAVTQEAVADVSARRS